MTTTSRAVCLNRISIVFLVVMAVWGMAYKGSQITPSMVQEMPDKASCEAVAKAILEMSGGGWDTYNDRIRCVVVPQ